MGCLQVRRWVSFLPAGFVVYVLLHYLVYQPDLSQHHHSPLRGGGDSSNGSLVGVAGGRSLQSGPRVLPPLDTSTAPFPSSSDDPHEDQTNTTQSGSAPQPPSNYAPVVSQGGELGLLEWGESRTPLEVSSAPPEDPPPPPPPARLRSPIVPPRFNPDPPNPRPQRESAPVNVQPVSMPQYSNSPPNVQPVSMSQHFDSLPVSMSQRSVSPPVLPVSMSQGSSSLLYAPQASYYSSVGSPDPPLMPEYLEEDPGANYYSSLVQYDALGREIEAGLYRKTPPAPQYYSNSPIQSLPLERHLHRYHPQDLQQNPGVGLDPFSNYPESGDLTMGADLDPPRPPGGGMGQAHLTDLASSPLTSSSSSSSSSTVRTSASSSSVSMAESSSRKVGDSTAGTVIGGTGALAGSTGTVIGGTGALAGKAEVARAVTGGNGKIGASAAGKTPVTATQTQKQPQPQQQQKQQPAAAPHRVTVVQGTGSQPQTRTVTKKTTVIKKTSVTSSTSLAINALKGKIKVGERYESGFGVPQEELCQNNGRELKVLVLITTAPDHEKHRTAVRQTWGHFAGRRDVVMAFMIGRTGADLQAKIDHENELFGDIIQANFVDHYSNLTLKTVSMFEWVKTYCSESHFVLKTDDDMFINVPLLLSFVDSKPTDARVIYGRMAKGWKPVRNKKSKYYIDTSTYSKARYPDFLTGPAYLLTSDVVDDIYHKALDTTFFVLEDVLITGIVAESLRIRRVGDSRFRNEKIKLTDSCSLIKTISIHMVKYEEQFDIYKRTLDGKAKCKAG